MIIIVFFAYILLTFSLCVSSSVRFDIHSSTWLANAPFSSLTNSWGISDGSVQLSKQRQSALECSIRRRVSIDCGPLFAIEPQRLFQNCWRAQQELTNFQKNRKKKRSRSRSTKEMASSMTRWKTIESDWLAICLVFNARSKVIRSSSLTQFHLPLSLLFFFIFKFMPKCKSNLT